MIHEALRCHGRFESWAHRQMLQDNIESQWKVVANKLVPVPINAGKLGANARVDYRANGGTSQSNLVGGPFLSPISHHDRTLTQCLDCSSSWIRSRKM